MTTFIASVKDQVTKDITLITSDEHTTKASFTKELKGSFTVRFIATEETFDAECEKFYAKQEEAKRWREVKREVAQLNKEINAKNKKAIKEEYRKENFINEECAQSLMKMYSNMGLQVSI